MVKRYSITLPDDLAEKFEEHKKALSLSVICRDAVDVAINDRINVLKRMEQGEETMEDVIERMKAEKKELEAVYSKEGEEFGIEWAKTQSYQGLKSTALFMIEHEDFEDMEGHFLRKPCAVLEEFQRASRLYESDHAVPFYDHELDEVTSEGIEWLLGFREGVLAVWDKISEAL